VNGEHYYANIHIYANSWDGLRQVNGQVLRPIMIRLPGSRSAVQVLAYLNQGNGARATSVAQHKQYMMSTTHILKPSYIKALIKRFSALGLALVQP
jgi:hypothetical protein